MSHREEDPWAEGPAIDPHDGMDHMARIRQDISHMEAQPGPVAIRHHMRQLVVELGSMYNTDDEYQVAREYVHTHMSHLLDAEKFSLESTDDWGGDAILSYDGLDFAFVWQSHRSARKEPCEYLDKIFPTTLLGVLYLPMCRMEL